MKRTRSKIKTITSDLDHDLQDNAILSIIDHGVKGHLYLFNDLDRYIYFFIFDLEDRDLCPSMHIAELYEFLYFRSIENNMNL